MTQIKRTAANASGEDGAAMIFFMRPKTIRERTQFRNPLTHPVIVLVRNNRCHSKRHITQNQPREFQVKDSPTAHTAVDKEPQKNEEHQRERKTDQRPLRTTLAGSVRTYVRVKYMTLSTLATHER